MATERKGFTKRIRGTCSYFEGRLRIFTRIRVSPGELGVWSPVQFGVTEIWQLTPSDCCKRERRAGQLLMGELQEVGIPGLTHKPRMCWDKESTSIYSGGSTQVSPRWKVSGPAVFFIREKLKVLLAPWWWPWDGRQGVWKRKAVRNLSILWSNRKAVFRDGNRVSPKNLETPPTSQYKPLTFTSEPRGSNECLVPVVL